MPSHLINPDFFILNYKPSKKISSLMTVFTIWNTMVGSSLLTLPWAFAHAGLLISFVIALVCGLSSMYTCLLIVKYARNELDFGDTAQRYFGKKGKICNLLSSVLLMLGATLGYYELLTQSLYPCIQGVIDLIGGISTDTNIHEISLSKFSLAYVCLGMSVILFLIFLKRDISCFIKLNSFGVLFVLMIILFNVSYAIYGFTNTSYSFHSETSDKSSIGHISLVNLDFGKLAGILGSGFLIHNFILVLLDKTANPNNNVRDVKCGFFFVFLSYLIVGTLGYFGFTGSYFNDLPSLYHTQVSLNIFPSTHPIAFCVRLCYAFQIISVFPLLFSITRTQFLALIGIDQRTATRSFWLFNIIIILLITVVGIVYPNVGSLMAYVGAFCGFVLIYFMPIVVQLKAKHQKATNPKDQISILITEPEKEMGSYISSSYDNIRQTGDKRAVEESSASQSDESSKGVKYWISVIGHVLILCCGLSVIVLQFVKLE